MNSGLLFTAVDGVVISSGINQEIMLTAFLVNNFNNSDGSLKL